LGLEHFARGRFARMWLLARLVPETIQDLLTIDCGGCSEKPARQNLARIVRIRQFVPARRQTLPGGRQILPGGA
jgi:hypothetical protein